MTPRLVLLQLQAQRWLTAAEMYARSGAVEHHEDALGRADQIMDAFALELRAEEDRLVIERLGRAEAPQ